MRVLHILQGEVLLVYSTCLSLYIMDTQHSHVVWANSLHWCVWVCMWHISHLDVRTGEVENWSFSKVHFLIGLIEIINYYNKWVVTSQDYCVPSMFFPDGRTGGFPEKHTPRQGPNSERHFRENSQRRYLWREGMKAELGEEQECRLQKGFCMPGGQFCSWDALPSWEKG